MKASLPRRVIAATFARSFLIQGSWNYHSMLGTGFAYAMLPALRRLSNGDADVYDAAVRRHVDHFNAHPYLSNLALGAAVRLEADGADPETIKRFKTAVRGPLGGLGDSLVWATWLPMLSMMAMTLWWLGLPGWLAVGFFVIAYNLGHVGLRVWAFRIGLREGRGVAKALAQADLAKLAGRLASISALVLGVLGGAMLTGPRSLMGAGPAWAAVACIAFVIGDKVGHRAWRPAAIATIAAITLVLGWGVVR